MSTSSSTRISFVFPIAVGVSIVAACSGGGGSHGYSQPTGPDAGPVSSSGHPGNGTGVGTGTDAGPSGSFGGDGGSSAPPQDAGGADGQVDSTPSCDMGLAVDDGNAASFARAIGICTNVSAGGYGLVSATYSNAFASATPPHAGQWGLLPKFGSAIAPREGAALGALSSGYAREYDDAQGVDMGSQASSCGNAPAQACCWSGLPGACPVGLASDFVNSSPDGPLDGMNYPTGAAPPGFPQSSTGCHQDNVVNDMIDVKLVLKAPMDAMGFRFDFDFYSSEWPNFVCSTFNDAFVAYLTSSATTNNISFDSANNPISVNNNFLNRCTAGVPLGCNRTDGQQPDPPYATSTCPAGAGELAGTGFAGTAQDLCGQGTNATLGGATGWLTTQAAIQPGEQFTLEFMIWDAGDGLLDSTVLIDNFQWVGAAPPATVTQPVPQ